MLTFDGVATEEYSVQQCLGKITQYDNVRLVDLNIQTEGCIYGTLKGPRSSRTAIEHEQS
jgi:hypothetical protein